MGIPQKIDEIIASRKRQLPKIAAALERAASAKSRIEQLDRYRSAVPGSGGTIQNMIQENPEFAKKLESISTKEFYDKYIAAEKLLSDLRQRFERDEVHISFVGRAGQGKSLVLQKISGLPGSIIPSADGADCTGAKSIISNSPGEETKAKITFYTEQEFAANINQYLEKIFNSSAHNIASLNDIPTLAQAYPGLKETVSYTQVRENSLLEHLEKYIDHAQELRGLLGRSIVVPEEEIESYVAQYQCDDISRKYYQYLAVKEAEILASFPCTQCGKIVLEDTIGIGATSLNVREAMLETVQQSSDAVIYMLRPDPCRPRLTEEDYTTIQELSDAVGPEYARQMLFWVVNRVESGKGQNDAQIPEIMDQLAKQDLPVAKYLDVNCAQQQEVEDKLLLPVLNQMSDHLTEIDGLLLKRANEQLRDLEDAYRRISNQLDGSLGASLNPVERRAFRGDIKETMKQMAHQVRLLSQRYSKQCEVPCKLLQDATAVKLKNLLLRVPKDEEILTQLHDGFSDVHEALKALTERVRVQTINDFLDMNPTLHELVINMKREVVHLLADKNIGRLCYVVEEKEDPDEWLQAMMDKLENNPQFPGIYKALKVLREFDLRMENFLIYKVRVCLTPIDFSMLTAQPAIKANTLAPDEESLVEELRAVLRDLVKTVHDAIRQELDSHYTFPNEALFAVTRDFYDRIAKSESESGSVNSMHDEWSDLYEDMIPFIWAGEHRRYMTQQGAHQEWDEFTTAVRACAEAGYFAIK